MKSGIVATYLKTELVEPVVEEELCTVCQAGVQLSGVRIREYYARRRVRLAEFRSVMLLPVADAQVECDHSDDGNESLK